MKQINVAVVGVSGVEKDKGQIGVGKSCLCNRFVRSTNDCYFIDHISVLSQSDFSGRVVNNDHFLYWGEARKTSDEGVEYNFSIIEQTEFVDDATFQPFKVGKMEPYAKRCAAQRIYSAEKLMYICKNQLGIEREYEQIVLPDGRMVIDGYLCVFDVSIVPNRSVEKQVDFVTNIIANLLKNKKPIVLVTTKNDDASELYVREAEKICQRKEYKNSIIMIETSSHESINVDSAFIALAQLIEKVKQKSKIITYNEAAKVRKELLDTNTEYVTRLIRSQITDYRSIWTSSSKKLASHKEWQDFLELFGQEAGQRIFRRHLKKLREDHTNKKLQRYMDAFVGALQDLMPEINMTPLDRDSDWVTVKGYIRNHMDFGQYFFDCGERATWPELSDVSDMEDENRIPFDVLDTPEAENVFKNHMSTLQQEQKRLEWKKQFKKLLEETGYVTPGKQLSEVRVLFMGRECFEALSEHDCQQIYDNHQRDMIDTAKHNFQELLLEHADLFYHFKSIEPSGTITQNDIKDITDVLQEDFRYKLLDRLDQDRKLMLFQHLGFVHCPIREHCPAFPNCIDAMIERILATNNQNIPGGRRYSHHKDGHLQLNLVVIGLDFVANEFIGKIHLNCNDNGEYMIDGQTYVLNIETINRDNDSFSFDLQSKGIICVFSNHLSFEYCYEVLDKLCMDNIEFKENITNLHLVLMNDIEGTTKINLEDSNQTRQDAKQLAEKLHCIFVDDNNFYSILSPQNQQKFIDNILNSIVETIPFEELKYSITDLPDIRIILCMFCGDPYSVEFILTSLMSEQSCVSAGERNIVLELFLGDTKRRVEIILSSYHGANAFRDELVHGFILLYSTKRKASLATLSAFSFNIPNLPMQIVSVTEQGGVNAFFNNEICQMLMTDGNALADKLRAHFATSSDEELHFKFASFAPFLREVWEKKPEIEHAFHMEEPLIDSGEGTMEHSISKYHRIPQPPPRYESYLINNNDDRQTYSNMYFYEENNSDGDGGKDERLGSRGLNQGFQIYPPPTTPPEPAPPDHLLTPSSILRQLKTNAVSASQSSLEEINSDVSGSKESLNTYDSGWLDDNFLLPKHDTNKHNLQQQQQQDERGYHAFTTGRRSNNNQTSFTKKPRPKGPSQTLKQPGKLNLKTFAMVNEAIARMNLGDNSAVGEKERKLNKTGKNNSSSYNVADRRHAPLAAPEDEEDFLQENNSSDDDVTNTTSGSIMHLKHNNPSNGVRGGYVQFKDDFSEAVNNVASHLFTSCYSPHAHKLSQSAKLNTSVVRPLPVRRRDLKEQQKYSDSESDSSSLERKRTTDGYSKINRKPQGHKRMRKKRVAIPVLPPKIPPPGTFPEGSGGLPMMYQKLKNDRNLNSDKDTLHEDESSVSSPRENSSPIFGVMSKMGNKDIEREKLLAGGGGGGSSGSAKVEKQKWLNLDSRKSSVAKDEEKKSKKSSKSNSKTNAVAPKKELINFKQSDKNLVPLFLEKCVQFIELEGLDSEGIYRVPGNRAHVDLLYQKFDEAANVDMEELDIPVNAVATALKDFFSKRLPPLFEADVMNELEEIAGSRQQPCIVNPMSMEVKTDRSCRLLALRGLLNKLPPINFAILKFIFQHFVRVSENAKLNSMDSKNLAICWWPTLLPIEFTDMGRFESMRPYLEDIVQTMIDQFPFLFCGKEAFVMV